MRELDTSRPVAKPRLRGVSHQIAAFVSPILGLVLVALASTTSVRWAALVYTVGLTLMYATSALYHRVHWSDGKRLRLRRLDHSMIMVAIAATYTPVAVAALDVHSARVLLAVVWSLAVVGVVVQMVWLHAPRGLVAALYIAIGWTALAFAPTLWRELGVVSFSLLVLGGIVYSIGAVVYSARRPDPVPAVFGFHEVFHALVIVAGLVFYAAIVRVVLAQ
jgi:hemolysin III